MIERPTDDRPTEGHWLTYGEAAQLLGISSEALRSLARRHRWDRRSPNAIGGQAWVLVPADRLPTNGRGDSDQRLTTDDNRLQPIERPVPTNGRKDGDQWSDLASDRRENRQSEDVLTAMREMAQTLMGPVREQIADLKTQLTLERDRADRAEGRAQDAENRTVEAERRVRELAEKLEAEMIEHRRIVSLLAERLARRSWWPWRRR
jgi:hypothetical protein